MVLSRAVCILTASSLALLCPLAFAQSDATVSASSPPAGTAPTPSFEVATIKPHADGPISVIGIMSPPDGTNGAAVTLAMLVTYAYGLRNENQIQGVPDWAKTDRFDMQAKFSEADAKTMQKMPDEDVKARRRQMMQVLLADRFRLKVHPATKQTPVYELVIAKGGLRLKDAATDTNDQLRKGKDGKPLAGIMYFLKDRTTAQGYSMSDLANLLSQPMAGVGRPVLDKTGLTGTYNFILEWSPQMKTVLPGAIVNADSGEEPASIFTALGDLGLKLQPATGPVDIVIIDHAEHPSEN